MKKLVLTVITVLGCGAAYALPVGNPWEASIHTDGVFCDGYCGDWCDPCLSWCDAWSVRLGFYGDYVFNRNMELEKNAQNDIETFEIYTNAAYLVFNMWNRVEVFGTLGVSNIFIETPSSAFSPAANVIEVDPESYFSWSIGGRATLWDCGCFGLGLEGQYFSTRPDIEYFRFDGFGPVYVQDVRLIYTEWQVALGASYRINIASCNSALLPYVALTWSGSHVDMDEFFDVDTDTTLHDLESKKVWGWALGTTLLGCDKASVTVEGRFASEKAVYVNGQFRF